MVLPWRVRPQHAPGDIAIVKIRPTRPPAIERGTAIASGLCLDIEER